MPRNAPVRRESFLRRLSLRRRNSKRQQKRPDRVETRARKSQQERSEVVESQSFDSFSGSGDFEYGGGDGSPNNNDRQETDEQYQSSYYQSPREPIQSGSHHYNYPTVIDDYNEVWNRSSTFGSQNPPVSDPSSYQHPVPINDYSTGPYVNPDVSIIEIS